MNHPYQILKIAFVLFSTSAFSAPPVAAPSFQNEKLHYAINWPSGLSLGEAELSASERKADTDSAKRINLSFNLDAGIPGFAVSDLYRSAATAELCSVEFDRKVAHGRKRTEEKLSFDHTTVTRQTTGGGRSETQASACARDALAFLYYVRHELIQGRIPAPQKVFLGSAYDVRLEFGGAQSVRIGDKLVDTDRVTASIKGPASAITVEVFFLKDEVRTPALVRVPLALGTFSMELSK